LDTHLVWPLYQRLRHISPAEFGAFIHIGSGRAVLSVSPELFLKVSAGGLVETRPIKGTRRRGATTEEDQELRSQLLESEKDRAELAMIVDVSRNDLGRVCRTGSVKVLEHARLMTLPTLHHTFSRIEGILRPASSVIDLLRASFPPASVTGAPKIEAMRAAAKEEGTRRGPAMGSIGWISLDGQLELSVAIRTAFTDAGRVFYSAGCGITADSQSLAELQESRAKASAFLQALGLADV
jgi:para-aminobenzoate synthetase component 1